MALKYSKAALGIATALLSGSVLLAQQRPTPMVEAARITKLPTDYRDFKLISVAHEAGSLNDIRAILGNDIAIRAYRNDKRPFPDGSVIVRLAYKYVASDQNNQVFGQQQSYVAGEPTNVQVMTKDTRKWRSTDGWGFGQFVNGKSDRNSQPVQTCVACHNRLASSRDLVFTKYAH